MDNLYPLSVRQNLPEFISSSVRRGRYVFIDLDPTISGQSPVACAGWEECAPDYEIRRQGFRFHAFEYIANGEWELVTNMGKWTLGPGSVFAYGPNIEYSLKATSKSGLRKYFLDFSDARAGDQLRKAGFKPGVPGSLATRRWVQDLFDQLIDTTQMQITAQRRVAEMLSNLLLERIREDLHFTRPVIQASLTYEKCREYLGSHYLDISNLADAAQHCGVSTVHLCRLFQRYATESPNTFITRLKINHAAERITRGNLSVKAAAAEVGFDDPYHFSRVFKKVHGVPPSKFGRT
jgi:AraC-like DNA-binding protein